MMKSPLTPDVAWKFLLKNFGEQWEQGDQMIIDDHLISLLLLGYSPALRICINALTVDRKRVPPSVQISIARAIVMSDIISKNDLMSDLMSSMDIAGYQDFLQAKIAVACGYSTNIAEKHLSSFLLSSDSNVRLEAMISAHLQGWSAQNLRQEYPTLWQSPLDRLKLLAINSLEEKNKWWDLDIVENDQEINGIFKEVFYLVIKIIRKDIYTITNDELHFAGILPFRLLSLQQEVEPRFFTTILHQEGIFNSPWDIKIGNQQPLVWWSQIVKESNLSDAIQRYFYLGKFHSPNDVLLFRSYGFGLALNSSNNSEVFSEVRGISNDLLWDHMFHYLLAHNVSKVYNDATSLDFPIVF